MSEQQAVSAESTKSYLQIDRLTKKFGDFTALDEVSLEVYEGEFICFLGPSGCGKTTFLRAIAGLDIQNSGTVSQAGKDISALPPSERDFGIVFQSYALFPNLTCERNIGFGLENQKVSKADIAKRVAELLEMVGLPDQGKSIRRSCRVANNNGLPWCGHWQHRLACYCSMNLFQRSMQKFAHICATK